MISDVTHKKKCKTKADTLYIQIIPNATEIQGRKKYRQNNYRRAQVKHNAMQKHGPSF